MKAAETDAQDLQRDTSTIEEMNTVFSNQSKAFWRDGAPAYDDRIANIDRLQQIMLENKDRIVDAIQADFGDRSSHEIVLAEIVSTLGSLKNTKKNLKKWMRPQKRRVDMMFQPGKAKIIYQPKGVAGIIAPWNYPFYLTATPLIGALAAGNRVMIKPSEATPETSALIKEIFGKAFDSELVHVTVGGTAVGAAFSKLSWDHLLFTGSTALGKIIMQAAAENLTPVTLELGGKSPLIIHPEYPVDAVVKRIIAGKCFNGGQTCVAPDYLLVAADRVAPLIGELETQLGKNYPTIYNNPDYTGIINDRHYARLQGLLEDAKSKGADLVEINPESETRPSGSRKLPLTLVLNINDDMAVMREEIFGPILPIVSYHTLDEAIQYVNGRERPLALYYFDNDPDRIESVLTKTISGNACINETVLHVGIDDLPFGGVGASGIGAYHGKEGFETFSHKKGILVKGKFNSANFVAPPYGAKMDRLAKLLLRS